MGDSTDGLPEESLTDAFAVGDAAYWSSSTDSTVATTVTNWTGFCVLIFSPNSVSFCMIYSLIPMVLTLVSAFRESGEMSLWLVVMQT